MVLCCLHKLKKNFGTPKIELLANKIEYFANYLDLSNRSIIKSENFSDEINYDDLYKKLDPWIEHSKDFLKNCIQKKDLS
jgi:hypothetical protein